MPEEYFNNVSNNNSGSFNQNQEPKFAPPASNIFIRTSDSDLENMKAGGGVVSNQASSFSEPISPSFQSPASLTTPPLSSEATIPSSSTTAFSNPSQPSSTYPSGSFSSAPSGFSSFPSTNETATQSNIPNPTPVFNPEISGTEFTNFSQPQTPKKNNKLIPLLIIGGIIIASGVLSYLFLWPKIFGSKTTPVTSSTTTTLAVIPSTTTTTLPPTPYPQISGPYQKTLITIQLSKPEIVKILKKTATENTYPAGTFSILIPKYRDYTLSGEEIITALIPNLPDNLKPYLLPDKKYLLYAYYGEVNPALGLIIDIGEENLNDVKAGFATWEKGKILDNLANFWLINIPRKAARSFKETTIAGAEVRYFSYSGKEAALGYGFYNNYLIISSSLESITSAINHLQGATEPIYP